MRCMGVEKEEMDDSDSFRPFFSLLIRASSENSAVEQTAIYIVSN